MELRSAWKIYFALLFGTFVTIEAAAFQAPVLPGVTRHFGIPINLAALVLLLYFLGLTVFAPIMGRLGDQVGRKAVLVTGLGLFAIAEAGAAWSPNFALFLAARFLQGLGVACIVPGVFAYVRFLFPEEKRGIALGVLTLSMTLGAASGGLLGGMLIDRFGWPSVYWTSGGLTLLGLVPVVLLVPETRGPGAAAPFDLRGTVYLFLAIAAFLSLPTWIANFGLRSPYTAPIILVGLSCLALLWHNSTRAAAPAVDVSILRRRAFALPSAIYWLHMLCASGVVYALAFFINGRPGGSASQFGFVVLFLYASAMAGAPVAGRLVDRLAPRIVVLSALSGTLLALCMFITIRVDSPLWYIVLTVCLFGLMMGANPPALMKMALGAVPQEKMGAGTGLFSMLRDLGNPTGTSFALAVFGTAFAHHAGMAVHRHGQALGIGQALLGQLAAAVVNKGHEAPAGAVAALKARGVEPAEFMRLANIEGLAAALPQVGYLLLGLMGIALLLGMFMDKAPGTAGYRSALTTQRPDGRRSDQKT